MKIKIIRCLSQDMEREMQSFLNSLQDPSQIIDIKIGGEWLNNKLAMVLITYLTP